VEPARTGAKRAAALYLRHFKVRLVHTMKALPVEIVSLAMLAHCFMATAYSNNLDFLNSTTAAHLTDEDRRLQLQAASAVLEAEAPKGKQQWSNPQTGSSGSIESLGNYRAEDGLHCRKITISTHAAGRDNRSTFPVCKGADGSWFFASGKKMTLIK
jgi:surface antigen